MPSRGLTGRELDPLGEIAGDTPWPEGLEPTMRSVDVGIARTLPELADRAEAREIEALYLAAIAGATSSLYIESQYLASRTLAEAIAARLREPNGPEVVLVLPRNADGWLEQPLAETSSLVRTVEALRGDGRTLRRFEPATVENEDSPLAENELMDPERTPTRLWDSLFPGRGVRTD